MNRILQGMSEAVAHARATNAGTTNATRDPYDVDIRALRKHLGMSVAAFARRFGFEPEDIEDFENGDRVPNHHARMLFRLIEANPEAALQVLSSPPTIS